MNPGRNELPAPWRERYLDADGLAHQCCCCRRFQRVQDGAWETVPIWHHTPPPEASGTVCEQCLPLRFPKLASGQ